MKNKTSRRNFLQKGACLFIAAGAAGFCSRIRAGGFLPEGKIPDPEKLEYCGYTCPDDCQLYEATLENNTDKKKEFFEKWKLRENHHVEFDPQTVFCYKCKNEGKPDGLLVKDCAVRNCAILKGYECCIQCDELAACDKSLWKTYPDFHNKVIEMQAIFRKSVSGS